MDQALSSVDTGGASRVLRFFSKPVRTSSYPATFGQLLPSLVLWISVVVGLLMATGWSPGWSVRVALCAGLAILGEFLLIPDGEGRAYTCSDVFYVFAFVALPLQDAATVLLVAGVVSAFVTAISWWGTLSGGVAMFPMAAALAVASPVAAHVDQVWGPPLAVVAGFLALRAGESLMIVFIVSLTDTASVGRRLSNGVYMARGMVLSQEVWVQVLVQAPMSILAVYASSVVFGSVLLALIPFGIAWRSARQASRLAEAHRRIGTDALTGLANRGRFFELAGEELRLAGRFGHGVGLIMGDLDNFKRVNDTLGHLAGDEVLRSTAEALRNGVSSELFPTARYGGEEFVVIVPALDRAEVLRLAEQIRVTVEDALGEWGTSISLGVAFLREGDRLESLIDRADKALYSAKFAGKNRVHEWRDGVERPMAA